MLNIVYRNKTILAETQATKTTVAFIIYTMQAKQYNMYSILQKVLVLSGENVK